MYVVYTVCISFNNFLHSWWRHHFWCYLIQQGSFWLRPLRITAGVALLALGLRPCGVATHQLIGQKLGGTSMPGAFLVVFLSWKWRRRQKFLWLVMNLCAFCYHLNRKLVLCWFQQDVCCSAQCFKGTFHSFLRDNDLFDEAGFYGAHHGLQAKRNHRMQKAFEVCPWNSPCHVVWFESRGCLFVPSYTAEN